MGTLSAPAPARALPRNTFRIEPLAAPLERFAFSTRGEFVDRHVRQPHDLVLWDSRSRRR